MSAGSAGIFRDRTLITAASASLLWHAFWFFSISVTVSPRSVEKPRPAIVSLGPVLDDAIFRALVETKPELSKTYYRHLSDFSSPRPASMPVHTMERTSPGDVVSIPTGRRFEASLRGMMSGEKAVPGADFVPSFSLPEDRQEPVATDIEAAGTEE